MIQALLFTLHGIFYRYVIEDGSVGESNTSDDDQDEDGQMPSTDSDWTTVRGAAGFPVESPWVRQLHKAYSP